MVKRVLRGKRGLIRLTIRGGQKREGKGKCAGYFQNIDISGQLGFRVYEAVCLNALSLFRRLRRRRGRKGKCRHNMRRHCKRCRHILDCTREGAAIFSYVIRTPHTVIVCEIFLSSTELLRLNNNNLPRGAKKDLFQIPARCVLAIRGLCGTKEGGVWVTFFRRL